MRRRRAGTAIAVRPRTRAASAPRAQRHPTLPLNPAQPSSAPAHPRPVSAIPTTYNGILMRSRLEARWAAVLDAHGLLWEYEPQVIRLGRGYGYMPDFWLPGQACWLEVKGPHWERFDKTQALARRLGSKGLVLVATASGVCWRVPYRGAPAQEEAHTGVCRCGTPALGVPTRGTLSCRAPQCGRTDIEPRAVLGW